MCEMWSLHDALYGRQPSGAHGRAENTGMATFTAIRCN